MRKKFVALLLTAGLMVTTGCGTSSAASTKSASETKNTATSSEETATEESTETSSDAEITSTPEESEASVSESDPSAITADEDTDTDSAEEDGTEASSASENSGVENTAAETSSGSATNIKMKTSDEYSAKIPAITDYFSQDPEQSVESDAGLSDMFSYCNMDEVHAYVDALKSAGFTNDPSEIDSGDIYQYAATTADGYYVVLTCQYVESEGIKPYTSLSVTKK